MPNSRSGKNGRHRADESDANEQRQQNEAGNEDWAKLPRSGKRTIGRETRPEEPPTVE
jgi:hypothetical protein